ncbi:hypothetical protein OIU84_024278 [Salix udensis]|uniref:Uncharacterized protein n=1 Tax=Salix udensis TaxID=889485 RepID=A0AAD6KIS5_9ROSI|nr:hypothetical protein OIU84_024278 [Salix udensis]
MSAQIGDLVSNLLEQLKTDRLDGSCTVVEDSSISLLPNVVHSCSQNEGANLMGDELGRTKFIGSPFQQLGPWKGGPNILIMRCNGPSDLRREPALKEKMIVGFCLLITFTSS